tara:strand:+ start:1516 stop:1743 length:228 start_codon:yes stop_codon:yes gene_type:complete
MFEHGKTYEFKLIGEEPFKREVEEYDFPFVKLAATRQPVSDPVTGESSLTGAAIHRRIINVGSAAFLYATEVKWG